MSEPAGLPRHPYPVLLPEAGGFEEAMGRARARRRRQAFEATAALSVVALLAGGVLLARPNESTLGVADSDRQVDRNDDGSPVPAGTTSAAPSPTGTTPVVGGYQVPVEPDGRQPADPGPSARPSVPTVRQPAEALGKATKYDVVRGSDAYNTECPTETSTDWCLYAAADGGGNLYTLKVGICRLGSDPLGGKLTFKSEREVDYQISLGKEVIWTWSLGQSFEPWQRVEDMRPGQCVKWETRWDAEDEYGRLVPYSNQQGVGKYELVVRTTAEELGDRTASTEFQVLP